MTATVVKKKLAKGRIFTGLCTGYLSRLTVGDTVRCYTRTTTFKLPKEVASPIILVGAGAGLAPLRAMVMHLDTRRAGGEKVGENMLVFGCRRKEEDYIYEEEVLRCVWVYVRCIVGLGPRVCDSVYCACTLVFWSLKAL